MVNDNFLGSKKLASNIAGSSIYKLITIASNLLLVRVCVNYMGEEKYGIWLTLLSFFVWFSVLEVGISSSLRNKLTKYFTVGDSVNGKKVIGGAYRIMAISYVVVIVILVLLSYIFPIESVFLPTNYKSDDFSFAFRLSSIFYMLFYIAYALNTILLSIHFAKQTYLIAAIQSLILLLGIYLFNYFNVAPSFTLIFSWFTLVPLVVWGITNLIIFKQTLVAYSPTNKELFSGKSTVKHKMNYGFFIIQLCTLVIFSTDNLIIINQLTGSDVLKYNVAFKYFNILIVVFNLILVPYWSSFTEAVILKNRKWIVTHIRKLILIWFGVLCIGFLLLFTSNFAYKFWIGKDLNINFSLSIFMFISILLTAWNSIFAYFLNAISQVKSQTILLIISACINIPLSLFLLSKYDSTGVIMATCISLLPLSIVLPIDYYRIIKKMK